MASPRRIGGGRKMVLVPTGPVLSARFQFSVNAPISRKSIGDDGFHAGWREAMEATRSEAAIRIDAVSKLYAGGKQALDNVSFDVPRGEIFGLLGPNGAGKSTLINILAGLVNKTSGSASIWGFDIDADPRNAKYSIGKIGRAHV